MYMPAARTPNTNTSPYPVADSARATSGEGSGAGEKLPSRATAPTAEEPANSMATNSAPGAGGAPAPPRVARARAARGFARIPPIWLKGARRPKLLGVTDAAQALHPFSQVVGPSARRAGHRWWTDAPAGRRRSDPVSGIGRYSDQYHSQATHAFPDGQQG